MQSDMSDAIWEGFAKQVIDSDRTLKDGTMILGTSFMFKQSHPEVIQQKSAEIIQAHRKIPHFKKELNQTSLMRHYNE